MLPRILLTSLLALGTFPDAARAEDAVRLVKTVVPGCMKFVTPNGRNWYAVGKMGVMGASCPAQFSGHPTIQAKPNGSHSIALSNGMTCVFDDTGTGSCH